MKTKIILILFLFLNIIKSDYTFAQDPNFEWANQVGGSTPESVSELTTDQLGNVFSIGAFEDSVDFNPGLNSTYLHSYGEQDIFIQKLDVNGNFIWVKHIGGISYDRCNSITTDDSNNIYLTGRFRDTVDFDPGIGVNNLISEGHNDIFILKLDNDGELLWVKQMGGSQNDYGLSIRLDLAGNIYTTGWFDSTVDFDPGVGVTTLTSTGEVDTYIQKLDANGNFLWVKQIGELDEVRSRELTIDAIGNLYLTGHFMGTTDFDPGTGITNLTSAGDYDIFIQKLNSNGNLLWAKQMGGIALDQGFSIAVNDSGHVYTTGRFNETVDFDPGAGVTNLISAGNNDIFIQKLNANGDLLWANKMGGTSFDMGNNIALDSYNNVYLTGTIDGAYFLQKSNNNGDTIWLKQTDEFSYGQGISINIDEFNNIYTAGRFQGTIDLNPETGVENYISNGFYDVFIQKLSQCTPSTPIPNEEFLVDLTDQCSVAFPVPPIAINNCGYIFGTTTTNFPITAQGTTLVTWTYDDGNGNILTQNQNIIIEDTISPIPDVTLLPSINALCEITTSDVPEPTSIDNCTGIITGHSDVNFPITDQSITEIIWTYEDVYGNSTTQTQAINWTVLDITTAQNGFSVTANNTNATYQWLNCDNSNLPLSGENNATFTATTNGNFAVEITENGCIDTSACISIAGIGLNAFNNISLAIYPNPSTDVFNITFEKEIERAQIKVSNSLGQHIYSTTIEQSIKTSINLVDKPAGLYLLTIISHNGQKTIELVKE